MDDDGKAKVKRVWILGAGFSRPLGGPLLADLFTMRGWRKLCQHFRCVRAAEDGPLDVQGASLLAVYALYLWGRRFPVENLFGDEPHSRGEDVFDDAENFFVEVEKMSPTVFYYFFERAFGQEDRTKRAWVVDKSGNQKKQTHAIRRVLVGPESELFSLAVEGLEPLVGEDKDEFSSRIWNVYSRRLQDCILSSAKRLMALECSAFLWELEKQKARAIDQHEGEQKFEAFIPFQAWAQTLGSSDAIVTFNYDLVVEKFVPREKSIPICKMHGSVHVGNDPYSFDYREMDLPGYDPQIGVPGTAKANMLSRKIWDEAAEYLETAEHIVFMGYGLPESDANAREFLLQHLRLNPTKHLAIEIVLGEPGFRTERLEATIEQCLAHRNRVEQFAIHSTTEIEKSKMRVKNLQGHGMPGWKEKLASASRNLAALEALQLKLSVRKQYAQDYMQAYALANAYSETLG